MSTRYKGLPLCVTHTDWSHEPAEWKLTIAIAAWLFVAAGVVLWVVAP